MRTWPAVIGAPVLALVDQGVAYALVPWSCSHQETAWLHATHAVFLLATLATLFVALRPFRMSEPPTSPHEAGERHAFFGAMGIALAAFSVLVIASMWAMQWFLPACNP